MKNVKIILGPQGSGKTSLLIELVKCRRYLMADGSDFNIDPYYRFQKLNQDTEIICIDSLFGRLDEVKKLIKSETMIVNRKYLGSFEIITPDIIITSSVFTAADFSDIKNIQIINCKRQ